MIAAHLRKALLRIQAGNLRGAQINVEYARSRLMTQCGPLPPETDDAE